MTTAAMSVVLVTPDDVRTIRRTLRHLREQTIASALELVLVAPSLETLGLDDEDAAGLGAVQVVDLGTIEVLADARAAGVARASAPIIGFAEDHCYPAPRWAESIVAAHRRGGDAVCPQMHNENPRSALSRAAMVLQFCSCAAPTTTGPRPGLAWHNTSYRRDALLAYGTALGWWLTAEGPIQDRLRDAGRLLMVDADAEVSHVNISRARTFALQGFWGGRLLASTRSVAQGWSTGMRFARAAASPLVPFVRIARVARDLRARGELRALLRLLPALLLGTSMHALGEAVGSLVGFGPTRARYSDFEHGRLRHVNERDRGMLISREPPGGSVTVSTS